MSTARPAEILRQLEHTGAPDVELLAQFVLTKSAVAFEELVRRHGALVLGVCRRVTRNPQDAEDAFQATFLVLAQKAGVLRSDVRLWSWLYGVAFRVSWRARRAAFRRRAREVLVSKLPEPRAPVSSPEGPELGSILDEELAALSECYREAIILCDLRGASREEAATALGIPEGTLSSRLANGRKKFAARLAKRGIALSVAVLPIAVAEAQGATAVPIELIRKTCELVTDYASSGTIPGPLAELTKRGLVVRKTFAFGLVMVAAITGAVIAANPIAAPPAGPPKPPATAKTEVVALPQGEQKALPALATPPRIIAGWDLPIANPERVIWAPLGDRLAVVGAVAIRAQSEGELRFQPAFVLLKYTGKSDPENIARTAMPRNGSVVGFTPDGKQLVTDRRERHLLSGLHQLVYWDPEKAEVGPVNSIPSLQNKAKLRTVSFDGVNVDDTYAFDSNGKTFRAVSYDRGAINEPKTLDVIEVDTTTGKSGKPLVTVPWASCTLSPNGKRLAFTVSDGARVRVYDIDNRDKPELSVFALPDKVDAKRNAVLLPHMFSPDGNRLVIFLGSNQAFVVDALTGKSVAALEGEPNWGRAVFNSDGRLLAMPERSALTIWDTSTGRRLKSWKSETAVFAFHPTRPLLVVAEPNGEGETRLGFWDFSAEVEKK
ncbi:sigma-70 family rna polymerase sigma factor : RNA polymerase sigma factor, sigma-70 family OS=Singulisphaera acidiphila (strain ATCC BAA-1392 / DSM 18658 / VKM B-2454 / MOB10) GN=Sinac_0185 PE=4 SV=1: Sigma70_r2: Sigma70_r4_2: PD40 [Gemmata massiliana]|uniref:ECF RNA polymerase sigma factor SigE n=1 Tax=Gemmata massiliana TaxID=1210884 RepID=A0A6P2D380_9BACT|nr:sigma-70 family RNA polymerase sigma factor [Gemmata massiliana]VTR94564.1 sigma-70 family rna polymerase sigma factor : RNA polymerase sigma factor, sigma-70 family OS=Singulisphaera acidiphila (strain ATCC BAA-1392 / DSM 18658 / VKM B-2454 / MOB10) GN=Sinac_0185 PE=4 SV=1: Sigma70_r2: Sigma70_r4_2: PD40 [Gemmata massiliana]